MILAKALLKVVDGHFGGSAAHRIGFYVHTLSGYIPQAVPLTQVCIAAITRMESLQLVAMECGDDAVQ
jgi:hypothetical protein